MICSHLSSHKKERAQCENNTMKFSLPLFLTLVALVPFTFGVDAERDVRELKGKGKGGKGKVS